MMAGAGGAFVAVGTVLPAVYGLADRAGPSAAPAFGRRLLEAVAGLVTGRPRVPAAALLVLTVLAAASATNVGLAEDVRGGAEPTPARERLERVGERFGSQDQAVVVVDAPARDVREPLHALSVEVAGIDGVSTVDSPTLRAAALSNGSLPEQDRYEDLLRNTSAGNLSADGVTRVDVRYDGDSEGALAALREASDSSSLDAQLAGPGPLQDASRGLLVENLVYSTAGALALILLTLAALHREPRWTAVAFGPLGVVVIWQFGIMGAAGVSLNPVTGVTTAMVLGIGVDYTVHLTERVRSARSGGEGPSAAGRRAVLETGAPILATTATTVAAFGLLGASANPQVAQFGLVAAVVIASAFVVALVLVPLASRWAGSP
jgi:predicted RND superfamily exporter protein